MRTLQRPFLGRFFGLLAGLSLVSLMSGCVLFPDDLEAADLTLRVDAAAATQYNFRGMTNVSTGVVQTGTNISLPTKLDGVVEFGTWGNMDLRNNTGDAWFPDGHAGKFSEIDFDLAWSREIEDFFVKAGLTQYNLQHGAEFFIGERGETAEVFVSASRQVVADLVPTLVVHYDFDEVEDFYLEGILERPFELGNNFSIAPILSLGYSSSGASLWSYGLEQAALADLRLAVTGNYQYDARTRYFVTIAGSTIVDNELSDWFSDQLGIDPDQTWVVIGLEWTLQ